MDWKEKRRGVFVEVNWDICRQSMLESGLELMQSWYMSRHELMADGLRSPTAYEPTAHAQRHLLLTVTKCLHSENIKRREDDFILRSLFWELLIPGGDNGI